MKNLLQSKIFKRNLIKWFCMYCGVMCILTIVITYSRYITSLSSNDSARVSMFNVDVSFDKCSDDNVLNGICYYKSKESVRPVDKVEFYFNVDTNKLEVNTLLFLYVTIKDPNKVFDNKIEIMNVTNSTDVTSVDISDAELSPEEKLATGESDTTRRVKFSDFIKAANGGLKKYKVILTYDYKKVGYDEEKPFDDIIKVGYSATQQNTAQ